MSMPSINTEQAETPASPQSLRFVTRRSVLLGMLGVLIICGLTPFNDFALANTFFVGNFLPVGLLLLVLVLVTCVNAPLHRFAPRWAFSRGELAVALTMSLVSCALPASGFMRYVPASLIGLNVHSSVDVSLRGVMEGAELSDWLFPMFESSDPFERGREPVAANYIQRTPGQREGLLDSIAAVPWRAWARPAIAWGIFALAMFGAVLGLTTLIHRQWVENERLSFPLAQVYLSLVEAPEPRRSLAPLFRERSFWIAVGAVFVLHAFNPLASYFPEHVPRLLGYNFNSLLTERPFNHVEWFMKSSTVYFSIIGVVYFVQSSVSFSLWFFVVLSQVVLILARESQGNLTGGMRTDISVGATFMFGLMILYVGRQHWWMVLRQMFGRIRENEPLGDFVSYRLAGWCTAACLAVMMAWIVAAGADVLTALVLVAIMMLAFVTIYRIVAETGLTFVSIQFPPFRPWHYLLMLPPTPIQASPSSFFMASWFHQLFLGDMRETAMPMVGHALRVGSEAEGETAKRRKRLTAFIGALILALAAAFVISGVSTLVVEYNYADTLAVHPPPALLNQYGVQTSTRDVLTRMRDYLNPSGLNEAHSMAAYFAMGATICAVLSVMRLRFAWWPLHPIGLLLVFNYPMQTIWLSVFIGWLLKTVLVRFGGAAMLASCRPFFLGLIVGEAVAAAFWLVLSIVLYSMGIDFRAVSLLPT